MPDKVPFFTLFESFQAPRQLRLLLHDTVALGGVLDRAARTLEVQLESGEPIPDAARTALQQMLAEQYDLRRVQLTFRDKSAPVKGAGEVLLGKEFKGKPTPIAELNLKMGAAIVEGRIFKFECFETRRPGVWRLSFNITDERSSVSVRRSLGDKEAKQLAAALSDGAYLRLQGRLEHDGDFTFHG